MKKAVALTMLLGLVVVYGFGVDVNLTAPSLQVTGALATEIPDIEQELQLALLDVEQQLETSQDVQRFTQLGLLAEGFANAGAASSHLGTPRAFSDYRSFALVLGTGIAAAAPGVDASALTDAADQVEEEGNVYVGGAIQPITVGLGVNIDRWVSKTRAYVKVGYFDLPFGSVADEVAFNSLSLGLGASYQIIETRQLPLGFLRWRGVSLSSGLLFQRNQTDVRIDVSENAFSDEITFGQAGYTNGSILGISETDTLGTVEVSPTITASIESRTVSIPWRLPRDSGFSGSWTLTSVPGLIWYSEARTSTSGRTRTSPSCHPRWHDPTFRRFRETPISTSPPARDRSSRVPGLPEAWA